VKRFALWGFRSPRELVGSALGPLERQVMEFVWQAGQASVRDVHAHFRSAIAYTTIMTTVDRLAKKGLLSRRKTGRAFSYAPTATSREIASTIASELVVSFLDESPGDTLLLLSTLVDTVGERDRSLLPSLERLVRRKRREGRRGRTS
jgi:predicted transcriptional regulator